MADDVLFPDSETGFVEEGEGKAASKFAKSTVREIIKAIEGGAESQDYAPAMGEYRLRSLRMLRQAVDAQRKSVATIESLADRSNRAMRQVQQGLFVGVGLLAVNTLIALALLLRHW